MKKILFVILPLVLITTLLFAQQKKRKSKSKPKTEHIKYLSGFYSNQKGGVRIIGNVFEMSLQTNVSNIIIDSVWFGATPVPCDVYSMETNYKVDTAKKVGRYLLKVNKNLYRNFYYKIDSSEAARNFKAPFEFYSDAIIMYRYKGKRYYQPVYNIEYRIPKDLRQ